MHYAPLGKSFICLRVHKNTKYPLKGEIVTYRPDKSDTIRLVGDTGLQQWSQSEGFRTGSARMTMVPSLFLLFAPQG